MISDTEQWIHEVFQSGFSFTKANSRRITNSELHTFLVQILNREPDVAGYSMENRPVFHIKWGKGPHKILFWSQMHGNEPTATLAILDLLFLLNSQKHSPEIQFLESSISLHILPMINPDGAERFQRRNAAGIDLNRDAVALAAPESNLLKRMAEDITPTWGFNLHDQNPRYSVGNTGKVSAVSLLAPAFNREREDNPVRIRAKKLAGMLANCVRSEIGNHVGKYDDAFGSRCFGDNMQAWGISTVLIESGGWFQSPDKPLIRSLNLKMFLTAFLKIADGSVDSFNVETYEEIPFNGPMLTEWKLTDAKILSAGEKTVTADIAVNFFPFETLPEKKERLIGLISDVGALHPLNAIKEEPAGKGILIPSKAFEIGRDATIDQLKEKMLNGYSTFQYPSEMEKEIRYLVSQVPANFMAVNGFDRHQTGFLNPGERASWMRVVNDKLVSLIVNGFEVWNTDSGWIIADGWGLAGGVTWKEVEL